PAAYLTGYLAGLRAKKAEIENAVLDSGLLKPTKGGRIYAALKGLVDAGIDIPHGDGTEPDEERLKGKHLNENIEKIIDQIKEKMVI
ncbi:MAG: 50S ribosomal protein L18, partial [Thermoplasmata archaeon]